MLCDCTLARRRVVENKTVTLFRGVSLRSGRSCRWRAGVEARGPRARVSDETLARNMWRFASSGSRTGRSRGINNDCSDPVGFSHTRARPSPARRRHPRPRACARARRPTRTLDMMLTSTTTRVAVRLPTLARTFRKTGGRTVSTATRASSAETVRSDTRRDAHPARRRATRVGRRARRVPRPASRRVASGRAEAGVERTALPSPPAIRYDSVVAFPRFSHGAPPPALPLLPPPNRSRTPSRAPPLSRRRPSVRVPAAASSAAARSAASV